MSRTNRLALLAAAALILILVGTVVASPAPTGPAENPGLASSHEPEPQGGTDEAQPSAEDLAHAAERLTARGITTDAAALAPLAEEYGLGGAVRLRAWEAAGHDLATLRAMRDEGRGWGDIARSINEHPGIGWIMGGGPQGRGLGTEHAPGLRRGETED